MAREPNISVWAAIYRSNAMDVLRRALMIYAITNLL